jgi:hypothetical protein
MSGELPLKSAVTVSEMARMVGLSRARFYQLQKAGIFPPPQMNPSTKRPFYDQVAQQVCLEVRKKNCGVNGQVVLFYARRQEIASTKARPKKPKPNRKEKSSLVESLKSLGLTTTNAEVEQAVKEVFPGGTEGKDESEVVTAIFLHLKRRNRGDSVGR